MAHANADGVLGECSAMIRKSEVWQDGSGNRGDGSAGGVRIAWALRLRAANGWNCFRRDGAVSGLHDPVRPPSEPVAVE